MPTKLARILITPSQSYVCLSCRLQNYSTSRGRTTRLQHTEPTEKRGGDAKQEPIPKDAEDHNASAPRSRISDIIHSFIFKSDAEDKETKGNSRIESPGKNEHSHQDPESIPSIAPQPKDSADVLQRKLQQKFAAQRRKDMLAMQASQALRAAGENEEVFKARAVSESTKQSPKSSYTRAERRQKLALEKKSMERSKRSKQEQAKPVEVPLNGVADFTTSTELQSAEERLASIEASTRKSQERPRVEDKDASENDNKGSGPGEQTATAQKLKDIMDILESSRSQNLPRNPMKVARKAKIPSKDTKRKAAIVATLNELENSGENPDVDHREAAAMISYFSNQLLAHLKESPEETPGSLHELRILHKRLFGEDDSLVRRVSDRSPPTASMEKAGENASKQPASMLSIRKHMSNAKEDIPPKESKVSAEKSYNSGFVSLQAALIPNAGKVKGEDLKSPQILASEKVQKTRAPPKSTSEKVTKPKAVPNSPIEKTTASDLEILPVKVDQPPVPSLAHGLERVLFNPGVYQLQDPRSRVFNFDPYLQKIMPVAEFDFNALNEYITSSKDESLIKIAKEHGKRYMGSTSSMTEVLAHFHFLLSQWRPIDPSMLSKVFPANLTSFTAFQRIPSAIFLRWKDGSYAIDADKQFATANVLSMLGKSMEKLLTLNTDDFERYRKSNPGQVTEDELFAPESYHYSTLGDFLMRSQLDAHDPRLPGTGMFDLKTRSVVSIRMDVANYEQGLGYEIKTRQGEWESYEREYHDMIRAAFLKYSLQVRMGRMDGIFVAFHNIERIFGFQYISLPEMDSTLHGQWDTSIGDQEFRLSLDLMNKVLDRATKKYPETSLRIHFETREVQTPFMYVFAEPVTEEQVDEIQSQNSAKIQEFERKILGLTRGNDGEMDDTQEDDSNWENIQADVQEAMDKDELSIDEPGQQLEAIGEDTRGTGCALDRPKVFEQGPLYATKNLAGVDGDVTAASAGSEGDDGESEDDGDIDGEEEHDDDEEEEWEEEEEGKKDVDGDRDPDEDGALEKSHKQQGLEEVLEDEVNIEANDADEAKVEVGGDDTEENDTAPIENNTVGVQNLADLLTEARAEENSAGAITGQSGQGSADGATESTNGKHDTSISPDAKLGSILDEEGQRQNQTEADQGFLDSIDQEFTEADTIAKTSPKDVLAMTLTLRNKVNGKYVLRPEKMTAADKWSIEYSLVEVSEQSRARTLYEACQRRRSKKWEVSSMSEDTEVITGYIQRLREMTEKGRAWRKEQDKKDRKRPVQVL